MDARSQHPANQGKSPRGPIHDDDVIETPVAVTAGRACCCPAAPVVRVIMPPTATRPGPTELLLCGHHYRVAREALAAAQAAVTELRGGSSAVALLPDLPGPRLPT